jgi:hypothetical protein
MAFEKILAKKRSALLNRWFQVVLDSYPEETAQFLKTQKDPFANPVGRTIRDGLGGVLDLLLENKDVLDATPFLDDIIRVRAIQDFSPSQALVFVFQLKGVIRDTLAPDMEEGELSRQLLEFEPRIDRLGLLAFDIFTNCRAQLHAIRVKEAEQRAGKYFERANALWEKREQRSRLPEE